MTSTAQPAEAATINVGTVRARMSNHVGDAGNNNDNCIRYSPVAGSSSSSPSAWVEYNGTARTAHGKQFSLGLCPGSLSTNTQSALGFTPLLQGSVETGSPFLLGRFEHVNNPVYASARHYTGDLEVQLGTNNPVMRFPWSIWETPNTTNVRDCIDGQVSSTPCDDRTRFDVQIAQDEIEVDGRVFRFVVQGFSNSGTSRECAAVPAQGMYPNEFWTQEGITTYGCLYATLSEVRELEIVKETVAPLGSAAPASFNYTTDSSLAGSVWSAGAFEAADVPVPGSKLVASGMLLEGETVTVTEGTLGEHWSLDSIACVDGAGGAVPISVTGQSMDITVGSAANQLASKITCTFTNRYEPTGTLTLVKAVDGGALPADSWNLSATRQGDPSHAISGAAGSNAVTNQTVPAGTYQLAETANSADLSGYDLIGWNCTGASGTTPSGANHAVEVQPGENVTCTATNKWQEATFQVTKTVVDEVNGFTGSDSTAFQFDYTCSNGQAGSGIDVSAAQPWTSPLIPIGTTCTVTETPPTQNLANASYVWATPQITYPGDSDRVTIASGANPIVAITNTVLQESGSLTITKAVQPRADIPAGYTGGSDRTFEIGYSCAVGDSTTGGTVTLADQGSEVINGIPAHSVCTFTEAAPTTQAGDFADPSYEWDGNSLPDPITVGADQNATATVVNHYTQVMGTLTLTKNVVGEGYLGGTEEAFAVDYNCGAPYSGTVHLADGGSQVVEVPRGVACTVTEQTPLDASLLAPAYEWGSPTYAGLTDGHATWDGNEAQVTVTNTTTPIFGSVTVTKEISGAAEGVLEGTSFDITLTCGDQVETGSIAVGTDFTVNNLPVGTECSVVETPPTGSTGLKDISYIWGDVSTSGAAIIEKDSTSTITVTNEVNRQYGALSITKAVAGLDGLTGAGVPFSGTWICDYDGTTLTGGWNVTGSGTASLTGPAHQIPYSAVCEVMENPVTTPPHETDGSYVWGGADITAPITITADTPTAAFTVTNPILRQTGDIGVIKQVAGSSEGYHPSAQFGFDYICTPPSGEAISGTVHTTPGAAVVSLPESIPVGSECTITEQAPPAPIDPYRWDGVSYSLAGLVNPREGAGNSVTFTVPGDIEDPAAETPAVTVTFTNAISAKAAALTVHKTVAGATDGVAPDAQFDLAVRCAPTPDGMADATPYGTQTVGVNGTASFDVPLGQYCEVVEITNNGGLIDASYTWSGVTYPDPVQVSDNGAAMTVTNHVARQYGALSITKAFTANGHEGAIPADREFGGTWTCDYSGTPAASFTGTWTATKENPQAVLSGDADNGTAIPLTSNCQIAESTGLDPLPQDPSYSWGEPEISDVTSLTAGTNTATVTNTLLRNTGSLTVTKTLSGFTEGFTSETPFDVSYTCTNPADAAAPPMTGTVSVTAGEDPITLVDGVPAGWECSVTEGSRPALADASYTWDAPVITIDEEATSNVTVLAGQTHAVDVENPIDRVTSTLTIMKVFGAGQAATLGSELTYGGTYQCDYGDGAQTYSGTWQVTGEGPATLTGDTQIPLTSLCEVTETELPELPTSWQWATPHITQIQPFNTGSSFSFIVTNSVERVYGSLNVTKAFDGPEAALTPDVEVTGTWACSWDGDGAAPEESGNVSGSWSLPAAGGSVEVFTAEDDSTARVPLTADCVIREDTLDPADLSDGSYTWNAPSYVPEHSDGASAHVVLVADAADNEALITNSTERVYGTVAITKQVTGPALASPEYNPYATFEGTYECTYGDQEPVTGTWGPITAGETATTITPVLVGSECAVFETPPAQGPVTGDSSYIWVSRTVTPESSTVMGPNEPATFTVHNTTDRITGAFGIAKAPLMGAADGVPAVTTFGAIWTCEALDGEVFSGTVSGLQPGAQSHQIDEEIPQGALCTVAETPLTPLSAPYAWNEPQYVVTGAGENGGTETTMPHPADPTLILPAVEFSFNNEAALVVSMENSVNVDPTVNKEFVGATQHLVDGVWNGEWDIAYDITVTNPSTLGTTTYQLVDEPVLEAGITINSGYAASDVLAENIPWQAGSDFVLAEPGTELPAQSAHIYRVNFTITAPMGAGTLCDAEQEAGLLNRAHISSGSFEASDEACGTLPDIPTVTMDKNVLGSPIQLEDGSWQVEYEVEVTNTSEELATIFTLDDALRFGEGISVISAAVSGPGVASDSPWDGIDTTRVVTDQPLAEGAQARYTVAVNATVAVDDESGSAALNCELEEGETGTGFLNEATAVAGGEETTSEACAVPVIPEVAKTFTSATQHLVDGHWDGSWEIHYNLAVTNPSDTTPVRYGLIDQPDFDPEVTIHSGQAESEYLADAVEWVEGEPFVLVAPNAGELPPGTTHHYQVTFHVSTPNPEQIRCGDETLGLTNRAGLNSGEVERSDQDCGEIPEVSAVDISKTLAGVTRQADGSWLVEYDIQVVNPNLDHAARYTLHDQLRFGDGIEVETATVSGERVPEDTAWDGLDNQLIVENQTIAAGATDEYRVAVTAQVVRYADPGSMNAADCYLAEDESGTGFLNVATIESEGDRTWDDACGTPFNPDQANAQVAKEFVAGSAQPVIESGQEWEGLWQLDYVITVTNPDEQHPAQYHLRDDVSVLGAEVQHLAVSGGALAEAISASGASIVIIPDDELALLAPGEAHTYQVRVLVQVPDLGEPLTCDDGAGGVVNTATLVSEYQESDSQACGTIPALPQLTLIKLVHDAAGADVTAELATQWTLSATHESDSWAPISGPGGASGLMLPGTVTLLEESVAGVDDAAWMAGNWVCTTAAGNELPVTEDGQLNLELPETAAESDVTCVIINAERGVDLALDKEFTGDGPITQGDTATYTITIRNLSELPATGVQIVDELPSDLLVDLTTIDEPAGWSVAHEGGDTGGYGGTLIWTLTGPFEPGAEVTVTYSGQVHELAGDLLVNTATVSSTEVELNPGNNTDTEEVPVGEKPVPPTTPGPTPAPPTPPTPGGNMPSTGVQIQVMGILGGLLLVSGVAAVAVARARRNRGQADQS